MFNILGKKAYWFDNRLYPTNHNQYAHEASIPASREEWQDRAMFTKVQLAQAAGLIPDPDFPDLAPEIWDESEHAGIIIWKVSFESVPGLLCTGSLYIPKNLTAPAPGILCPYGHWKDGRFNHDDRGSIPSRCIRFAQLGFVVFCYDMLGKCDNSQIMHTPPLELDRLAELYGVSHFALQTWNSIRALDFLCNLPTVDEERIGCTGASGGGTQTWTITALDERIKVFAPVCMLSSHFQGGCICEEGPMLRINGLTSFDVIAACAPRPVILPSVTQDWTNLTPRYEYQALQKVYDMLGASKYIKNFHADSPHNYNKYTREHVYPWFCHFLMGQPLKNTIPEGTFEQPPREMLAHNLPHIEPTPESTRQALEKIRRFAVKDALGFTTDKRDFNEEKEGRLDTLTFLLNVESQLSDVAYRVTSGRWTVDNMDVWSRLVSRRDVGDIIPAFRITPLTTSAPGSAVLLLSPEGKNDFLDTPARRAILDAVMAKKKAAFTIDYLGTGETADMVKNAPRNTLLEDLDFYAFNQSLFSMRCQDVLTTLRMMQEDGFEKVTVIAFGEAARVAACAVPLADNVSQLILDLKDVHDDDESWLKTENFQPLIYKVGGLKGCLSLFAPRKLAICNADNDIAGHLKDLYKTLGMNGALAIGTDVAAILPKALA